MPIATRGQRDFQRPNAKYGARQTSTLHALFRTALWIVLLAPAAGLYAQQADGWVGNRVVPKYSNFQLRIENTVIDPKALKTYVVKQVNGPWLWLRVGGEGLSGWALADQVVPVEQAIAFFTDYIRSNSSDPFGYYRRAIVWREKKELDIALRDCNEAIRLDPTRAYVYNGRGSLWSDKKEYDKAIADYNEAIRLDPAYAMAYSNRGLAWHDRKDYDKAMADYNEAIRLDPTYAMAYSDRGLAWHGKKDYDKAIADSNEAIRLDPKLAMAYSNRGLAWHDKKDYDKAMADYNEAIRLDHKYAMAYSNRALAMATCPEAKYRDGKRAVESEKRACELTQEKEADSLGDLAAALAEAGEFDEAVKWQTNANALYADPEDKRKGEERLKLYRDKKPYRETNP